MNNKRQSIILVDDEEVIRYTVKEQMKRWYDVHTFSSGAELLNSLDYLSPSLFIIDWLMPGMDGLTLCREIRKQHRLDPVPVAFFTGVDPSTENMRVAFEAGAQSFISKISTSAFVLIQIRTLIDHYQRLSNYLRDRKIMLSVLEHEIANLLTGVTTGVDVLVMHPAFKDRELKHQSQAILKAARELRELFLDLDEVLTFYSHDPRKTGKPEQLADILDDLHGYLANVPREMVLRSPGSLELVCDRRSLGRALYYQIRFIDSHLPADLPVTLEANKIETGILFIVSVPGCFKLEWEKAFLGKEETTREDSRHDLLFVEYIRNVMRFHHAEVTVREGNGRTELHSTLPRSPRANKA